MSVVVTQRRLFVVTAAAAILVLALVETYVAQASGRGSRQPPVAEATPSKASTLPVTSKRPAPPVAPQFRDPLPGMPPIRGGDVYGATRPGMVRHSVAAAPAYLYVPNSLGAPTTTVIDQRTRKVVRVIETGSISQHVTPSYDLTRTYVEASASNQIVHLDPMTGRKVKSFPVDRPYNLYFTPDGRHAIVMDEEHQKINFTDPKTFRVQKTISGPGCRGPNHADFSANGRFLLVSCEFSGSLLKISTSREAVTGQLTLEPGAKPQDVRLSPDGSTFYVADMSHNQLLELPWNRLAVRRRTPTPAMPHGIYPSRDSRFLYVSDRGAGEVSVFSLARHRIVATWHAPPGGTPDMGGLSADGRTLWLSGRSSGAVYGWDTRTGKLVADIAVGGQPHGILVWPQPGRYSLGHTGNLR